MRAEIHHQDHQDDPPAAEIGVPEAAICQDYKSDVEGSPAREATQSTAPSLIKRAGRKIVAAMSATLAQR
jgi:hypothetical protein